MYGTNGLYSATAMIRSLRHIPIFSAIIFSLCSRSCKCSPINLLNRIWFIRLGIYLLKLSGLEEKAPAPSSTEEEVVVEGVDPAHLLTLLAASRGRIFRESS